MSPDRVTLGDAGDGTARIDVAPRPGESYARITTGGSPALPYRVVQVLLPHGTTVGGVDAEVASSRRIATSFRPQIAVDESSADAPRAAPDPALVAGDASGFPDRAVRYLGTGVWHGRSIASFAVFPFRVHGDELHLATDVEVTLRTGAPQGDDAPLRAMRMGPAQARAVDAMLSELVQNPEAIATYPGLPVVMQTRPGGFQPTAAPSLEGSPVDCVIITTDALAPSYQRLADRKTAKGVPTVVRTVEWIVDNYQHGSDVQETLRHFIQDAYAKWGAQFFLLGGDTNELPARYLYTTYYYGGKFIPCDMYFEGLDGTWNNDHDSVFGEWSVDAPDLYSEVYVTRLPTSTPTEVDAIVDKIASYEEQADTTFADKFLFLAEVLFPTPWSPGDPVQDDGATIAEFIVSKHLAATSMELARMYERWTVYAGSIPESRAAAIDSMNAGYNHIFHIGHGYRFNMHTADVSVTIPDADALTNDHQFSNLFMLNCSANAFDFDCLGEHFLKNPNGGMVSALGAANSAFATVSAYYMDEYVNFVFKKNVNRIGEAHARSRMVRTPIALLADNADLWTHYIFAALADPEMQVWTGPVGTFTVSHPDTIAVGTSTVAVDVWSGGSPFDSATVCLWKDEEDYQTKTTDALGDVSFSFACETPGSISVVVTGLNRTRHESTIYVAPLPGAYLAFDTLTIDDDALGGTFGNGDGVIDAGETVDLIPWIANTGDATSSPAALTLASGSPLVTILDAAAATDAVPAAGTLAANDPWRITVGSATADESVCEFDVHIVAGAGIWDDSFAKLVHAPVLAFTTMRVDDSAPLGNGDGVVTSGELFRLHASVKNYGTGSAYGLTAAIVDSSGGGVTILGSTDSYPDLFHLAEAENVAGFVLSEVSSLVENAIEVTVTDAFARTIQGTVELRPPAAPQNLLFDASLGPERIRVTWDDSPSPDVDRYHVYHSTTSGGPYARVTSDPVLHTAYTDVGLASNTRYYYVVRAVDSSGNESPNSAESSASTNPQQSPGWPNYLTDASANSPILGDLDSDGDLEVVVGNNYLYAWHHDGQEVRDGDGEALTYGVFSDLGGGYIGPVALAKLDSDFGLDIVAAAWSTYEVYCFNVDGAVLPGWPRPTIDRVRAGMLVCDLDGDESPEVVAIDQNGYLYAWHGNGAEVIDGDANPLTQGVFKIFPNTPWSQYQAPCAADIDGDGLEELLVATQDSSLYVLNGDASAVPGWPRKLLDFAGGGLAIGDIDNNGQLDIVVPTKNAGHILALRPNNTSLWERWFPQNLFFNPSPALADIDGDGRLETFLPSSNGWIYAIRYNGSDLPGWPVRYSTTTWTESSPIIADITGDGQLDVILGDETQFINAWDKAGLPLPGFPLVMQDAMRGTPAVADLDRDGDLELVAAGFDRTVYVWDFTAPFIPTKAPWPMKGANWHRNSLYGYVVPTAVDDTPEPLARAGLEQNYPNPFNPQTTIVFHVPDRAGGRRAAVSLVVYDVTGARVRTLVDDERVPGRHTVEWDGVNDRGNRVGSGVYFYRLVQNGLVDTKKMVLLK